jgi:hypothetical protein
MIFTCKIVQFKNGYYGVRKGLGIPVLSPYRYLSLSDTDLRNKARWFPQGHTKFTECATLDFWTAARQYESVTGRNLISKHMNLGTGRAVDVPLKVAELKLSGNDDQAYGFMTTIQTLKDDIKHRTRYLR